MHAVHLIVKKQTKRQGNLKCNSVAVYEITLCLNGLSAFNVMFIDECFYSERLKALGFEHAFNYTAHNTCLKYLVDLDYDIFDKEVLKEALELTLGQKDKFIMAVEVTDRENMPYGFRVCFAKSEYSNERINSIKTLTPNEFIRLTAEEQYPLKEIQQQTNKVVSFLKSRNAKIIV